MNTRSNTFFSRTSLLLCFLLGAGGVARAGDAVSVTHRVRGFSGVAHVSDLGVVVEARWSRGQVTRLIVDVDLGTRTCQREAWASAMLAHLQAHEAVLAVPVALEVSLIGSLGDDDGGVPEDVASAIGDALTQLGTPGASADGEICFDGFSPWEDITMPDEASMTPIEGDTPHTTVVNSDGTKTVTKTVEGVTYVDSYDANGQLTGRTESTSKSGTATDPTTGQEIDVEITETKIYDGEGDLLGSTTETKSSGTKTNDAGEQVEWTSTVTKHYDETGAHVATEHEATKTTTHDDGSTTTSELYTLSLGEETVVQTMSISNGGNTTVVEKTKNPDGTTTTKLEVYGADGKKKGGGTLHTPTGETPAIDVGDICLPAALLGSIINWNQVGAAITDPSPIGDDEIVEGAGTSIAPICPPTTDHEWTARAAYIMPYAGTWVTDPTPQ